MAGKKMQVRSKSAPGPVVMAGWLITAVVVISAVLLIAYHAHLIKQ